MANSPNKSSQRHGTSFKLELASSATSKSPVNSFPHDPHSTVANSDAITDLPWPDPNILTLPPSPGKKSHARRQPPGHVRRPRNAFILFRSALVYQNKVPSAIQSDHCAISRAAGNLWKSLNYEQRQPWVALAEREKENHKRNHPNYRYTPQAPVESQGYTFEKKRGRQVEEPRTASRISNRSRSRSPRSTASHTPLLSPPYFPSRSRRRSASCPPTGAEPVMPFSSIPRYMYHPAYNGLLSASSTTNRTQDDCVRRPSIVTTYHSVTPPSPASPPNEAAVSCWEPSFVQPPLEHGTYNTDPPPHFISELDTSPCEADPCFQDGSSDVHTELLYDVS